MEKIVEKWLNYARADLEAAEVLNAHPKSYFSYQLTVLHCHQAIEKIIKTYIVSKREEPKKTHNLIFLLEKSGLNASKDKKEYIEQLNPHHQPSRYPDIPYKGSVLKYDKETANYHLKKTKEVFQWIENILTPKK